MKGNAEWVLRAGFESMLIVVSIVLALAVDEWRQNRQDEELATQSLEVFEREIRQNLARVDAAVPYHAGLRAVVARMAAGENAGPDLRSVVEGLEPAVLLSTAWETALATGALTHLEFELVQALSLTYSLQARFREESRSDRPDLSSAANRTPGSDRDLVERVGSYLEGLVRDERELQGVYAQALAMIHDRLTEPFPDEAEEAAGGEDEPTEPDSARSGRDQFSG